jgi:photosystem II stability/assembly factor-like uncharacterized protein
MAQNISLLVGSPKGAFILDGDADRGAWSVRGPLCEGWPVHDISQDPVSGALLAGAASPWYGPAVWRSDDQGATWTHSSDGLTYGDAGPSLTRIWNVTADRHGPIYAGVEPAGLFRSRDGGRTWEHVEGLTNHPTRPEWMPGNGGLCLHSIVPSPTDPDRVWVGISSVGVFETRDGGASWELRNRGTRQEFGPERYPEFGQCVHKVVMAADGGEHLYQQNHCGVYRTANGGVSWDEITAGLPSEFGFPMNAHPRDPLSAWTIPLGDGRMMLEAAAAVWRTNDGGSTWQASSDGLPREGAYLGVLRDAMAVDPLDPAGVYFGTSTGQVYASTDEGLTWRLVAENLPRIHSVNVMVREG